MTESDLTVDEALAQAHRLYYGRLVGWLFRSSGDMQRAEDAVGSAFTSAVSAWRSAGVPRAPEAWLRVAARNAAVSGFRASARESPVPPESLAEVEAPESVTTGIDERLGLLFVCAHPGP